MSDKQLLEMAANNLGKPWKWVSAPSYGYETPGILMRDEAHEVDYYPAWNPLKSDGDALRLSVDLQIDVKQYGDHVVAWFDGGFIGTGRIPYKDDPRAATRRAIVIAAAGIGGDAL